MKYGSYEQIICEKDKKSGILRITLNVPEKRNPLSTKMLDELAGAIEQTSWDDEVRVIVIKGAGPGFSSGHDLSDLAYFHHEGKRPPQRDRISRDRRLRAGQFARIYNASRLIVAQVHGYAIGGAITLLEVCDFVVAAEGTQFSHGPTRFGGAIQDYVMPLTILTVGLRKAKEFYYLGTTIDAEEAKAVGLINTVVPADRLEEEVDKLARAIAKQPLDGSAMSKEWMNLQLSIMGVLPTFQPGYLGHAFYSNIRYEPGEFNILKEIRDHGVSKAARLKEQDREGMVSTFRFPEQQKKQRKK